jgi:hypothetical protein
MTESAPAINLDQLSEVGQLATGILIAIQVDLPVAMTNASVEQVPASDIESAEGALLILVRLLQDRAARRAHAVQPGETVVLASRMTTELGEVLGGPDQVRGITVDLEELLRGWATDDPSTGALLERYGRRWAHAGLCQLAMTTAALLSDGEAGWVDLGWAVDRLADLERSSGR